MRMAMARRLSFLSLILLLCLVNVVVCSREKAVKKVVAWAKGKGLVFHRNLTIAPLPEAPEEWGFFAVGDISPTETLISVPKKLMFNVQNVAKSSKTGKLVAKLRSEKQISGILALMLLLLTEKTKAKSSWDAYINSLPSRFHSLLYWSEGEFSQLQSCSQAEGYYRVVKDLWDQRKTEYTELLSQHPTLKSPKTAFGDNDLLWALHIILTRCWEDDGFGEYTCCPVVDMGNHLSSAKGPSFNPKTRTLRATLPLSPGQELYMSFGAKPNGAWLSQYGFVDPENVHERLHVFAPAKLHQNFDMRQYKLLGSEDATKDFEFGFDGRPNERLMSFLRIALLVGESEFAVAEKNGVASMVSVRNELEVFKLLLEILSSQFPPSCTSIKDDQDSLMLESALKSYRLTLAIQMRLQVKMIVHKAVRHIRKLWEEGSLGALMDFDEFLTTHRFRKLLAWLF